MSRRIDRRTEIAAIRGLLAGVTLDREAIRLERTLRRKYSADQPRAPAAQSDGGQWVPAGGAGGGSTGGRSGGSDGDVAGRERTLLDDGTQVLSIRIRAGRRDYDEQHIVTAPDGESRIFENSGLTQTIRDGATGAVLGRSTFTAAGAEPEAFAQSTLLQVLPFIAAKGAATVELALALYAAYLSSKDDERFGTTVLGLTANEYSPDPNEGNEIKTIYVGRVDQTTLDAACRENRTVEALTEEAVRSVRAGEPHPNVGDFGTRVHAYVAERVNAFKRPDFVAEYSLDDEGNDVNYGKPGSVRYDVFERTSINTICAYDIKTGKASLTVKRTAALIKAALLRYPKTTRVIVIQVKPRS